MANNNFVVQNGLTIGPLTIDAATGSITTTGSITSTSSSAEIVNNLTVNSTLIAGTINAGTIGNTGATLTGTLSTASQPNITTLAGVTSIGASGSTTLTGTLSTASQPNITTLAGVTSIGASGSTTLTGTLSTATQNSVTTMTGLTSLGTAGVTTTAAGNFVITGCLTVNGTTTTINNTIQETTEYVQTIDATTVRAVTLGNTGATLTGTLSTASQTNITAVGTLTAGAIGAGFTAIPNSALANSSITVTAGTGMSGGGAVSLGGTVTLTNAGVTSAVAGTGVGVSGATGAVTISIGQAVGTGNSPTFAGISVPSITHTGTSGTGDIGASGATFGTVWATATSAKYADLAENYQADKTYAPGTVVMFGGSSEVTVADADTTAVAGVVSTNPAHLMNGGLTGANVVPVAFTGRVPCQIIGPVKKGDLMVSAGFGYAKASANPSVGQVIGKALQEVTFAGKAVIEVVVGRF